MKDPIGAVTTVKDSPELKAVLAHQAALEAARKEVADLAALIEDRETKAKEALADIPSTAHVLKELENLHATAALGKIKGDALEKRDQELSKERARIAGQAALFKDIADRHQHALGGLKRLLAAARARVEELEQSKEELIARLLDVEVERAGDDYEDAAVALKKTFERMVGFERLFLTLDIKKRVLPLDWPNFFIPSLNLPRFLENELPNWPGRLYSAHRVQLQDRYDKALQFEETRLELMGVKIS